MSGWIRYLLTAMAVGTVAAGTAGCSRSMINYQISESLGTVGVYENNEPVETPKMQAEREMQEAESVREADRAEVLEQAEQLAAGYWYKEAIAVIEDSDLFEGDEQALEAVAEYQAAEESMVEYSGDIVHLNFPNLIVDTSLAIDGDSNAQSYAQNMITLSEFEGILQELYENNYVLIDIHSLAVETVDDSFGDIEMSKAALMLPPDKKPLVLSVENLNYASVHSGDGIATKLVLDSEGEVAAVYTDGNGVAKTGAYDVVPAVEQFIEENPDFSYQGARGIIGLSGSNGAFGYQVEEGTDPSWETNQETVRGIAAKLLEDGWTFASEGYSYTYMNDLTYDELKEDLRMWENVIGRLIGSCDTLIYPYGSEVDYTTEKSALLVGEGYRYLVGLWASDDFCEVTETYLRQTRRAITGYVLDNYANYFTSIFNVSDIIDKTR